MIVHNVRVVIIKNGIIIIMIKLKSITDRREKRNKHENERRQTQTDFNYILICNKRKRTYRAFRAQNMRKLDETFDL